MTTLICKFYLIVAACTTVFADPLMHWLSCWDARRARNKTAVTARKLIGGGRAVMKSSMAAPLFSGLPSACCCFRCSQHYRFGLNYHHHYHADALPLQVYKCCRFLLPPTPPQPSPPPPPLQEVEATGRFHGVLKVGQWPFVLYALQLRVVISKYRKGKRHTDRQTKTERETDRQTNGWTDGQALTANIGGDFYKHIVLGICLNVYICITLSRV